MTADERAELDAMKAEHAKTNAKTAEALRVHKLILAAAQRSERIIQAQRGRRPFGRTV